MYILFLLKVGSVLVQNYVSLLVKKKDIYWDYCIENLENLRMHEEELRESYLNIYEKEPTVESLLKFIEDIEIAKEVKDENQ